jgi:hypothetical protein
LTVASVASAAGCAPDVESQTSPEDLLTRQALSWASVGGDKNKAHVRNAIRIQQAAQLLNMVTPMELFKKLSADYR